MALLVLVVLAGIAGFAGYSEAVKIERRFRKGPLGFPARVWGISCGLAGLIVGLIASAFVVGALVGYVGYDETSKYERESGNDPLGVPSFGWAAVGFSFGTIGALLSPAFGLGALVAFVGYNGVLRYEKQFGGRVLRLQSMFWAPIWFGFGLVGALVTSTPTWGMVCSFMALVGALGFLFFERNALIAERDAAIAEKEALIAERNAARKAPAPSRAAPSTPQPAPSTPPPAAPARPVRVDSDLLPNRR
jgi:hypothetical protein